MAWKTEEEIVMNEELRDRFDKLDHHLEKQDEHMHEMSLAFQRHEVADTEMHGKMTAHIEEHERNRKWRIALWLAAIGAVITVLAEAAVKLLGRGH